MKQIMCVCIVLFWICYIFSKAKEMAGGKSHECKSTETLTGACAFQKTFFGSDTDFLFSFGQKRGVLWANCGRTRPRRHTQKIRDQPQPLCHPMSILTVSPPDSLKAAPTYAIHLWKVDSRGPTDLQTVKAFSFSLKSWIFMCKEKHLPSARC